MHRREKQCGKAPTKPLPIRPDMIILGIEGEYVGQKGDFFAVDERSLGVLGR